MFFCSSCHSSFDTPLILKEAHGAPPPYREVTEVCPRCKGKDFKGLYSGYCRCCGRKIPTSREYCNESCRKAGEEMWARQRQQTAERATKPLYKTLIEVAEYNRTHKTNLSYGQYTALKRRTDER